MEELIGKTIQNYEIISVLGKGGMGVVYKAYDKNLDRFVAIKMLLPQVLDKSVIIERFKREAKNQAKLSHPNIVTVYGFINYQNLLGIVMEYVDGESIEKIIFRQKRLHLFDAVYIMKQTLAGIAHAHAKGFIHRDIKPSNILLSKEGEVKIMDFGISKSLFDKGMTKTGAKVGTVYYMSPEQIKGEKITRHTDLYSIGCSFFEMITGQPPFDLDSEYEVMDAHLKKTPDKIVLFLPGTPPILEQIIQKSLRKDPEERYHSAEDYLRDITELEKYLQSINAETELKIKKQNKTSKVLSIFATISLILLFFSIAYFSYLKVDELLRSNTLQQFEKFNIQTLFNDENKYQNLSVIDLNTQENINDIGFLDNGFGYAVGGSGKIWMSSDKGDSWNSYETNQLTIFNDSFVFPDGRSFIVTDDSEILSSSYFFRDLKSTRITGDYALFKILFLDDLTGFVCGSKGTIVKTTDGGATWRMKSTDTKNLLFDMKFIDDMNGFAVGRAGNLLKTNDGGETWITIPTGTIKYFRSIDFSDENGIAVGGSEIISTDDGGETWNKINLPANIVGMQNVFYVDEDLVFVSGNKGLLIVSKDGGNNWAEIESNIFIDFNRMAKLEDGILFAAGNNGKILKIN